MLTVKVNSHGSIKYLKEIKDRVAQLSRKKVAVGFPRGKLNAPHYEDGSSIIDVAIRNNYGIGVPRREFMKIAKEKWVKFIEESFKDLQEDIIEGKIDYDDFLKVMGEQGAEFVRKSIVDLRNPPNAPSTIAQKGSDNPLVDSGDLSKAATYEVRSE